MTVSRETSLDGLLLKIAGSLNVGADVHNSDLYFSGITRPALGLLILAMRRSFKKPLLLNFDKNSDAETLYADSLNIDLDKSLFFPGSSSTEIDISGFNLENERYRSETVNMIRNNRIGIIYTSVDAANEPLIDSPKVIENGFILKKNGTVDRALLIEALLRWCYEQTDHTETPQTFSVRGGILDIFLPYSAHPVRIEFFGDQVDSVRIFNPRSQRTIRELGSIEILPPPSIKGANENKISLLEFFGGPPISINNHNGLFGLKIGNGRNKIDLGCFPVKTGRSSAPVNSPTIKDICQKMTTANIYLFSGNQKSLKAIEQHNISGCNQINLHINNCFYSSYLEVLCLSLSEIYNLAPAHRSRWAIESIAEIPQKEFSSLDEISWGDHLVHQDFGIGLYRGLEIIETHQGVSQEFIKIEYADGANVFVPVEKFNRVHKMLMTGKNIPALSTLNSPKWARQKQVAKNTAKEAVRDLVKLYTSRNRKRGFSYEKANAFMKELESSFAYDETPGQLAAIKDVFSDMEKESPVDRLICGDVGFGKTEVALRAALKAVSSGKKVLFLTPTTILADQHYISTKARLSPLGVEIELLSRFKTKRQQLEILEKMLSGSTDLVIGTHRLLSQDVTFPNLGLLIIDEEHRFGVKHKEKLRELRSTVDILTLTATPIPRTLQQSLLGIRDISRITTPPKTRRPIKTFVQYYHWNNIKKVINYELVRGGQVYFLHNDIASIPFIFKKLCSLFPNNVVGVAHGKLNTRELEKTVLAFFDGKVDILLCTTIIESGLDVANANTIIINNAQNFGLSQLYQIRGRVGRSHRQAYCYLLIPKGKAIGSNARKRLKAIEQFTTLGSGYDISLKDLEIRGAGNLFGYKQSGHMAKVGFEMYCKLLQEAVDETTGNDALKQIPKISVPIDSLLDSEYIPLVQDRLYFYQQLSDAQHPEDVDKIEEELRDRFGRLPDSAKNLLNTTKKRIKLTNSSIISLSIIGADLKINLRDIKPFQSTEQMLDTLSAKFDRNDGVLQFSPSANNFNVVIKNKNIEQALKALDVFVALFSN